MPGVLIDTDVAIDFLRGEAYAQPLLASLWREGRAVVSVLTVYELTAGMREKEKIATRDFIDACLVEDVSPDVAMRAGELYRKYRAKGITLNSLDCLIAATALVMGCKLATRNVKHYPEKGLLLNITG
ncbi:MAG: type II toxin-antitoxin system VapC family toxin [Geobacteraceae bacterium]